MCNCINELRQSILNADPTITFLFIECANVKSLEDRSKPAKTGQPVQIEKTVQGRKGLKSVPSKSFITHNFCPFCGVKYE